MAMRSPSQLVGCDDRIYVQIPAYRDSELSATLMDLYAKALSPHRLRVGVVWQYGPGERLASSVRRLPQLEIIDVPYEQSRGCNWARNLLQRRWRNEPYTLLLDSHHRFVRGWDDKLLKMHKALFFEGYKKPVITAYLPSYSPGRGPGARKRRPYKIYPFARESGLLTRLTSFPIPAYDTLSKPVEADFASLHFLFTIGAFNREVQFDPRIYFFGDEVVTSLRAYTHGYDLFHPHIVLGWHSFDRSSRVPHWNDHCNWHIQHGQSLRIMRRMFKGQHLGKFGAGRKRTVQEYEDHILLKLAEG